MQSTLVTAVLHSGPVGLIVFFSLVGCSVVVWAILINKTRELIHKRKINQKVLDLFAMEPSLEGFRKELRALPSCALKDMFEDGEKEVHYFFQLNPSTGYRVRSELLEMLERLFESSIVHAEKDMGHGQTVLATISVIAPFIGLFGTVVGIINTFQSIAELKTVELAVIAPGISEALVATAAGLFAAIPASIGFNVFRSMIREMVESMEYFALHLLKRLQLQLMVLDEKEA